MNASAVFDSGSSVSEMPRRGSVARSMAWLAFISYLLLWPQVLDAGAILGCAAFIAAVATHGLIFEARRGIRELMSLLNAIWLGLLIYALPIYVLSSLTDISLLLDMEPQALIHSARLTFISIAVTGLTIEFLRSWNVDIHRAAMQRIAIVSGNRQFYAAALLTIVYGANYVNSGVLYLVASGNRFEITRAFESGKMWFIQYLMTGVTIAFIYQHLLKPKARNKDYFLGLASVVLFWMMCLSLGNRRGLLTVIFAAVVCFVARSSNGKRPMMMLLITFCAAGLIGILRQDASSVSADQAFLVGLSNFLGEFIYPSFTLVRTVELAAPASFEFTWLSLLYDFISAQLLGQPFTFLAHRFALDSTLPGTEVMGFAYLPITEAYQNFGAIGAALSGAVMLTTVLFLSWICRNRAWVYLMLLSLTLDMNRSEFAAMVVQSSIVVSGFLMTTKIRIFS